MSRKKCHRKRYALVNPIIYAMEGAAITPKSMLDRLRMRELTAIEAFRTGRAGKQEWCDIADMLNICETMAQDGIGPEAMQPCLMAQEAMAQAHERHHAKGAALVLSAQGLQALRDSYEFHDLQRQSVPRSVYERAIEKTHRRVASNAKGMRVVG